MTKELSLIGMKKSKTWFEIDKEGLRKLRHDSNPAYSIFELIQNGLDAVGVTRVDVSFKSYRGMYRITVSDDSPSGFSDITHAYVLFAESEKKPDPTKRGRWNIGEKLAFAIAESAKIETKGHEVIFHEDGTRSQKRIDRESGSLITMDVKLTDAQVILIQNLVPKVLAPRNISLFWNGSRLPYQEPERSVDCTLPTEFSDKHGRMTKTERKTHVQLHRLSVGENGWLYEMGIPVMQHTDPWHYDVQQRVPVGLDRQGLNDSRFMKRLRTAVFNECFDEITEANAHDPWVRTGAENPDADLAGVNAMITARFGDKVMIADPADQEANNKAVAEGYNLILGGHLSGGVWEHVRDLKAQGHIKTTSSVFGKTMEGAMPMEEAKITPAMRKLAAFTELMGRELMGIKVTVAFINEAKASNIAAYGGRCFTYNYGRLGKAFFERGVCQESVDLIIHEFGHEYESNHLSENYYRALTRLGAKATMLALSQPELFQVPK